MAVELPVVRMAPLGREPRPLASSAGGGRHRPAQRGEIAQCSSVLMTCRRRQPHE